MSQHASDFTRRAVLRGTAVSASVPAITGISSGTSVEDLIENLTENDTRGTELRAGVGVAQMSWRVGASPGQRGSDTDVGARYDLYQHSAATEPGKGIHSEITAKAVVFEAEGERYALVSGGLYLMHTYIHKRVADLVSDIGIDREHLIIQADHNHSAPHGFATGAAVWTLTDAFDVRHWSYVTRQIAKSITRAVDDLQPAKIGAAQASFEGWQRNVIGSSNATTIAKEEPTPYGIGRREDDHEELDVRAGFPEEHFDSTFTVIRIDELSGEPIAGLFCLGMHPESLDSGHRLTTSEYPGIVERELESELGNDDFVALWFNDALGDIENNGGHIPGLKDWTRETFGRMEDMAVRIVPDAVELFEAIHEKPAREREHFPGAPSDRNPEDVPHPPSMDDPTIMPPTRDLPVAMKSVELPPPDGKPLGPTSSYITDALGSGVRQPAVMLGPETMTMWVSALRLGRVLLAATPVEPITDVSYNFKTRVDRTEGNVYQGYHWPDEPDWVHERIESNFSETELSSENGFDIPVMLSIANEWMGYCVSRWEFQNRNHYRQTLTMYGEESGDYLVTTLVDIARELAGCSNVETELELSNSVDTARQELVYNTLVALEQVVPAYRSAIPPATWDAGTPSSEPSDGERFEEVTFSWIGGRNAIDLPRVRLQKSVDNDDPDRGPPIDVPPGPPARGSDKKEQGPPDDEHEWVTVASSESHRIVVTYESEAIDEYLEFDIFDNLEISDESSENSVSNALESLLSDGSLGEVEDELSRIVETESIDIDEVRDGAEALDGESAGDDHEWTAHWYVPWDAESGQYRFVVDGTYRSVPGTAEESFFDPAGADETYRVVSEPFRVEDAGRIPLSDTFTEVSAPDEDGMISGRLVFEPDMRSSWDPEPGREIEVTITAGEQTTTTATYRSEGWFEFETSVDQTEDVTIRVAAGEFIDEAGNINEPVEINL